MNKVKFGKINEITQDELTCRHETIFRESLPRNSKWYCRSCFTQVTDGISKEKV